MSGDPTYITSHNNAEVLIERDEKDAWKRSLLYRAYKGI